MNIETRKINLAQLLFTVQKESVLDKIEALLNQEESSTFSEEQKQAIHEGLNSPVTSNDQVMMETRKKYPNLFK